MTAPNVRAMQRREIMLVEGPHDGVRLPLKASSYGTIKMIDGEIYHRMPDSYRPATKPGEREAQLFLWAKWWDEKVKRMGKQEKLEFPE